MKYGILGCGKHALYSHAIPGKEIKELELVALCDISIEQLSSFENAYGRKLVKFTDKNEFLASGINAVLIGTPDEFHYQDLVLTVKAGLHTFVEKPLGVTSGEINGLEKLLDYAFSKGIVVSSCHPRRYDPPFMWLKNNLPRFTDELGLPLDFRFDFSYHLPSKDWKHTRGLLLDHANHEVDLLHYLFGHEQFQATKLMDSYDEYHVIGKRNDGFRFSFSGTRKLKTRIYPEWVDIRFEKGEIHLDAHQGIVRVNYHEKDLID
jgi:predicted dehydrogenase